MNLLQTTYYCAGLIVKQLYIKSAVNMCAQSQHNHSTLKPVILLCKNKKKNISKSNKYESVVYLEHNTLTLQHTHAVKHKS